MSTVLVVRPEPGASRSAALLRAAGHQVIVAPLFTVRALPWEPPAAAPDAIAYTSAQAPGYAGALPDAWRSLPCYTVGARTAAAARLAGHTDVQTGVIDVGPLFAKAAADGVRHLLHIAGRERAMADEIAGTHVRSVAVYAADANALAAEARAAVAAGPVWVPLLSRRAARTFARLLDEAGLSRAGVSIAALSPAIAGAAGPGWARTAMAPVPTERAMLAAAGLLCETCRP